MVGRDLGIEGLRDFTEIGSGGFATVYAATDQRFGRTVAVKVLANLDASGRRRFEREQLSMGRMTGHPNVVIPYSSGFTPDGYPYLVMEFLSGGSLADLITTEGALSWDRAAGYAAAIADALGHGHRQGVLHRDVKPENILIDGNGNAKLGDFGIASILERTATQANWFSLAHAPPETFNDGVDRRDERSDLYSLASTLYMAVTGRAPYDRDEPHDSQLAYVVRIAEHPVPTVDGDPRYGRFLAAALAKDPNDRPQTAAQFIAELDATIGPPHPAPDGGQARDATTIVDSSAEAARPMPVADEPAPLPPPLLPLAPRAGWYHVPAGFPRPEADDGSTVLERYWNGVQWTRASRRVDARSAVVERRAHRPDNPLGPPPGWYDDPAGTAGVERQWDGNGWTARRRPTDAPVG